MAAAFVHNQNVDAAIAAEEQGHVFAAGMEPWLSQSGFLDFLQLCSISPGQAKIRITGQGFDGMISFTEVIQDKGQEIGESIMAATTAAPRINQPYRTVNNIKALVYWCRSIHTIVLYLDSRLFIVDKMSRCREYLDMEDNSQPENSINKPDRCKPINRVKWSKEFEN